MYKKLPMGLEVLNFGYFQCISLPVCLLSHDIKSVISRHKAFNLNILLRVACCEHIQTAVQRQAAVTAYFLSKQLTLFAFA